MYMKLFKKEYKPLLDKNLEDIIADYAQKSADQRMVGWMFMGMVIAALVAGALAFIYAEKITLNDFGKTSVLQKIDTAEDSIKLLESAIDTVRKHFENNQNEVLAELRLYDLIIYARLEKLLKGRFDTISRFRNSRRVSEIPLMEPYLREVFIPDSAWALYTGQTSKTFSFNSRAEAERLAEETIDMLGQGDKSDIYAYGRWLSRDSAVAATSVKLARLQSQKSYQIKSLSDAVLKMEATLGALKQRLIQIDEGIVDPSGEISNFRLIQTNVTRFGSVLLILFFIRIIIPQYRYALKLSRFFEARAYALRMDQLKIKDKDPDYWTSLLTPNMGFGPEPETPYDKVIELLKLSKK